MCIGQNIFRCDIKLRKYFFKSLFNKGSRYARINKWHWKSSPFVSWAELREIGNLTRPGDIRDGRQKAILIQWPRDNVRAESFRMLIKCQEEFSERKRFLRTFQKKFSTDSPSYRRRGMGGGFFLF